MDNKKVLAHKNKDFYIKVANNHQNIRQTIKDIEEYQPDIKINTKKGRSRGRRRRRR